MSGSLRLLDSDGREILAAIDDQPLRVELVLDEDPKSAPDEIEVQIIGPDGTKRTLTAERIDWGAAQPLYRSDLTTIEDIGTWSVLSAEFSIMDVENRHYVRFEYDDLETSVQVFESGLDAREWVTRSALADDIQQATNSGIALTAALREVRSRPASPERDHLEELIEARLASTRDTLFLLDDASATLNNPNLYAEQQIRGAQYYMNYAESGLDPRFATVDGTLDHAKDIVRGHIVSGVQDVVIGGYRMLVQATGVAQARTVLFGEDEMGQEVGWDGRAVAFLDLLSQGLLLGAA